MALAPCETCGERISTEARACPRCGAKKPGGVKEGAYLLPKDSPAPLFALVGMLVLAALGFMIAGLTTMYTYSEGGMIVGGDAYNYIIRANRGVGLIGAGIVSSVLATIVSMFALRAA